MPSDDRLGGVLDVSSPVALDLAWQASGSAAASAFATSAKSAPRERRYS